MQLRKIKASETRELVEDLWMPLAEEMEIVSSYNKLADNGVIQNAIEHYKDRLSKDHYNGYFLIIEGVKAGFITYKIEDAPPIFDRDKHLYISNLFIKEKYRGNGYATDLIDKVVDEAKNQDCEYVELSVDKDNTKARKLYDKKGFTENRLRLYKQL